LTLNQWVTGSNPVGETTFENGSSLKSGCSAAW
jgi:hypothetical protein